ncbi:MULTISPECIES: hypothetical protein [unclassified Butyrivibrio]|uniref:hypothetical protein n=1 Tax=unclassified Butyrivibrio TaxID=2639466 RepID=UPI0003B37F9F|nr:MULTISPECIES: hypothetical protein [unclassified Butyrivibrio]MDC7292249.1 hypothetical protein [Butyrivibrio sp. DSM 10294]
MNTELIQFYKYLITDYIKGLGVFDEAERHLKEAGVATVKEEEKDAYQKTDVTGYDYFYLSSIVRVDKIPDDIKKELIAAMENKADSSLMERAKTLAVSLIPEVLMADRNNSKNFTLMRYDLGDDGFVADDEIAFGFASDASFDEKGCFVSKKSEDERVNYMFGQKEAIQKAFLDKTGYKLRLFVRI